MPYSDIDDPKLPSNVKNMDDKQKKQWVAIFNSSIDAGKDEGYAFAAANGVVGKKELPTTWYDLPISDDVSSMSPPPGDNKDRGFLRAVLGGIKSLFEPGIDVDDDFNFDENKILGNESFYFVKDNGGRLRWFAAVSNNFKDRQREIISEEAHKEYIAWADKNLSYGELWLWHAGPGSRWGTCDWLDYCDGFQLSSGLVDAGKEYIAYNIAKEDCGVSHGFLSLKDGDVITKYRRFETSPLPKQSAANEWTGFVVNAQGKIDTKEIDMPLSPDKRAFLLRAGHDEKQVKAIEDAYSSFAQSLKENGVDYKSFEPVGGAKAMSDLIHHPHTAMIDHLHAHADGTMHDHGHHHGDGIIHHDSVAHEASMHAGVGKKEVANAHKTKPSQYADVPDDKFLDKENWKYPSDSGHIHSALAYFNHEGQKENGGYSDSQWGAMGSKLAGLLGSGYSYRDGRVVNANKATDGADDNDADDKADGKNKKKVDDTAEGDDASSKEIAELRAAVKDMSEKYAGLMAIVGKMAEKPVAVKSEDDRLADHFLAKVAPFQAGYKASESDKNVADRQDKQQPPLSWFKDMTVGDMTQNGGGN